METKILILFLGHWVFIIWLIYMLMKVNEDKNERIRELESKLTVMTRKESMAALDNILRSKKC